MKALFLGLLSSLTLSVGMAAPAGYETQLIKLSKSLKGVPASLEERQELQKYVQQGNADLFLQQKTNEYLRDEQFNTKLKLKVDELIRVKTSLSSQTSVQGKLPTSYDHLVKQLISENKSWDKLLTEKSYSAYRTDGFTRSEVIFYGNLFPQQEPQDLATVLVENSRLNPSDKLSPLFKFTFEEDAQTVAGILTTPRFFDRYVNTALNKNRRRAAAVFRVFLCDTMIATAPTADANSEARDFATIFPDHKGLTEKDIRKSMAGNIHGQQADCMKCHYKLDPMGNVFAFSAASLSPHPSPGALAYEGKDSRKVNIPLRGFGDLATKITQQPEYLQCQVSHFWRWYIGKDVALTPQVEKELVQVFEKVGRKPKDFIAYLVSRPEFKEKPQVLSEPQILAHRVANTFKSCNSCHDSQAANVWDLSAFPYGNDAKTRKEALTLLRKVLDIDNDGRNAEMPPRDSLWKPSQDEIKTIKRWLELGAPDFQGKPQVSVEGAK